MSSNKSRLGRGLGGLIAGAGTAAPKSETSKPGTKSQPAGETGKNAPSGKAKEVKPSVVKKGSGFEEIKLSQIVPNPHQPRREISQPQIEDLAQSIRSEGLIQPIVVRPKGSGFELIAGERRLRAFESLKRSKIPARVMEVNDASSAALALIENVQRENLNPIDEASAYASLIRDFGLTQEATAKQVGKSRAAIANALRLLTLSSEIQGFLGRRLLSTGHAKVLLGVEDAAQRSLLARRVIETGMSVREAEEEVRRLKKKTRVSGIKGVKLSSAELAAIRDLEKRLKEHLNANVKVQHGTKRGKLTIEYLGNDDLDRILEQLGLKV
ncbi:MAG: putative chromosome-partitioning protein ParB [Opitutia bacterium UBA7350]|nr:MAG: putative chromosome-partitioning protein ParB [Opitutae bacterium UBA7350]